jgi:hypothetical protein
LRVFFEYDLIIRNAILVFLVKLINLFFFLVLMHTYFFRDYINAGQRINAVIRNKHGKLMPKNIDPRNMMPKELSSNDSKEECKTCNSGPDNDADDEAMSGKLDAYSLEDESQ